MERPILIKKIQPKCAKCGSSLYVGDIVHLNDNDDYLCDGCWEDYLNHFSKEREYEIEEEDEEWS